MTHPIVLRIEPPIFMYRTTNIQKKRSKPTATHTHTIHEYNIEMCFIRYLNLNAVFLSHSVSLWRSEEHFLAAVATLYKTTRQRTAAPASQPAGRPAI